LAKRRAAGGENQEAARIACRFEIPVRLFAFADDVRHAALGDESRQAARGLERGDRPADVFFDGPRAEQPPEEGADRGDFAVHRRRADLAFLRAVDDPFAHLVCGDAARVGARLVEIQPCQELPDVVFVIADGERGVTPFGAEVSDEFR